MVFQSADPATFRAHAENNKMRQPDRRGNSSPPLILGRGSPTSSSTTSLVSNLSSSNTLDGRLNDHFQLPYGEDAEKDGQQYSPPGYKRRATFGLKTYRSFSSFSEKSIIPLVKSGPCAMWWAEIAWLFVSIILAIVIAVVLHYFDGQPLPVWPQGVSINTLLALLVGICRASSAWPVAEGISQLKWNWFAIKKRRLANFEAFDEASRGPYGSLKLLKITKGRLLGVIAAIIMVTGLITAPLTQASITYSTRSVQTNSGTAITMSINLYSFFFDQVVLSSVDLDTRMKQAIQQGIYNPVNEGYPAQSPICSSAECRWSRFSSLGVCASVKDVTEYLTIRNSNKTATSNLLDSMTPDTPLQNVSLPNGVFLEGGINSYYLNISTPVLGVDQHPANHTLSFSNETNLMESAISNFFAIYVNQTERLISSPVTFRATEVLLHFCVSSYDVEVVGGIDSTTQSSPTVNVLSTDGSISRGGISTNRLLILETPDDPGKNFTINREFVVPLTQYLASTFRGAFSNANGITAQETTTTSDAIGSAMFRGLYENSAGVNQLGSQGLQEIILNTTQNVAGSLTNTLRNMGRSEIGTIYISETYIAVNWAWLAFLIAQVALSALFLGTVIVHTHRMKIPVVKSSAVASLFALNTRDKAVLEHSEAHPALKPERTMQGYRDIKMGFGYGLSGWTLSFDGAEGTRQFASVDSPA